MKPNNTFIIGSALTLGAILVAIDHTRHPVPEAEKSGIVFSAVISEGDNETGENPCSLKPPPCSL